MTRSFFGFAALFLAATLFPMLPAHGGEYRLTNGDIVRGEPASFNEDGVVIRLDIGGFSPRLSWSKLTQETLKELAKNPQAAKLAEPFIEIPPEVRAEEKKKKEIVVVPPPRLDPLEKTSFLRSFGTPAGLMILAVLYLANLYATFEIAKYRNRSGLLCMLTGAVFPIAAPLILLITPTASVEEAAEEAYAAPEPPGAGAGAAGSKKMTGAQPAAEGGGLGLAGGGKSATTTPSLDGSVFKRGETTFNRRFFETKFAGFFRVVQGEAEKDLVLVIRAGRNDYVAKRISRISSNEMHMQLLQGGTEVMVPFAEVAEVRVRHKDAKG